MSGEIVKTKYQELKEDFETVFPSNTLLFLEDHFDQKYKTNQVLNSIDLGLHYDKQQSRIIELQNIGLPRSSFESDNLNVNVRDLGINIPMQQWDLIKDFEPLIMLKRYKKGRARGLNYRTDDKQFISSGFKKNIVNNDIRPQEFKLSENKTYLNFHQEKYFFCPELLPNNSTKLGPLGNQSQSYSFDISNVMVDNGPLVDRPSLERVFFQNFEIYLKLKIDGKVVTSNCLGKFRLNFLLYISYYDSSQGQLHFGQITYKNI